MSDTEQNPVTRDNIARALYESRFTGEKWDRFKGSNEAGRMHWVVGIYGEADAILAKFTVTRKDKTL